MANSVSGVKTHAKNKELKELIINIINILKKRWSVTSCCLLKCQIKTLLRSGKKQGKKAKQKREYNVCVDCRSATKYKITNTMAKFKE